MDIQAKWQHQNFAKVYAALGSNRKLEFLLEPFWPTMHIYHQNTLLRLENGTLLIPDWFSDLKVPMLTVLLNTLLFVFARLEPIKPGRDHCNLEVIVKFDNMPCHQVEMLWSIYWGFGPTNYSLQFTLNPALGIPFDAWWERVRSASILDPTAWKRVWINPHLPRARIVRIIRTSLQAVLCWR